MYNVTLGFGIFNKKTAVIIYDCTIDDLQKLSIHSVINKYPATSIDIEYFKDEKVAIIKEKFDVLFITGISANKRVQVDETVYDNITDSVMVTTFTSVDFKLEEGTKKDTVSNLWSNTKLSFPVDQKIFKLKRSSDEYYNFIFKCKPIKSTSLIFIK